MTTQTFLTFGMPVHHEKLHGKTYSVVDFTPTRSDQAFAVLRDDRPDRVIFFVGIAFWLDNIGGRRSGWFVGDNPERIEHNLLSYAVLEFRELLQTASIVDPS